MSGRLQERVTFFDVMVMDDIEELNLRAQPIDGDSGTLPRL